MDEEEQRRIAEELGISIDDLNLTAGDNDLQPLVSSNNATTPTQSDRTTKAPIITIDGVVDSSGIE